MSSEAQAAFDYFAETKFYSCDWCSEALAARDAFRGGIDGKIRCVRCHDAYISGEPGTGAFRLWQVAKDVGNRLKEWWRE